MLPDDEQGAPEEGSPYADRAELTRAFLQGPFWGLVFRPLLHYERETCLRRLRDRTRTRQEKESDDAIWGRINALEAIERTLTEIVQAKDQAQAEQADIDLQEAKAAHLVAGGRYGPYSAQR